MFNFSVHCMECDSQEVVMANAICTWDLSEQKWIYSENYDSMYQCSNCGEDSKEYIEKEILNA
jgi:hypothetical protein